MSKHKQSEEITKESQNAVTTLDSSDHPSSHVSITTVSPLDSQISKISELKGKIKSYDRSLQKHPNNHICHYGKAGVLVELGDLTLDRNYYLKALECYAKAISISPQGPYYCDRSKLYIKTDRSDMAAQDVISMQKLGFSENKVFDMYIAHTMQNILKFAEVQSVIQDLIEKNKIPVELANVFAGVIGVITKIEIRLNDTDERTKANTEELEAQARELIEVKRELANIHRQYAKVQDLLRVIDSVETEVQTLAKKLQDIDRQLPKLCTKEDFNNLSKKLEDIKVSGELFGGRLKLIEGKQAGRETLFMSVDDSLKASSRYNEQKVREDFDFLKANDPHLFDYANHFYWSLSNNLLAYRAISTGSVQGIRDKNQLEKIWDKVGPIVLGVAGAVPIIGKMPFLAEKVLTILNNQHKGSQFAVKIKKINDLINDYTFEKDLELAIAETAINVSRIKKEEILSKYKTQEQIQDKSVASTMAIKDVTLFINYIATIQPETQVTKTTTPSLEQEISNFFATHLAVSDNDLRDPVEIDVVNPMGARNDAENIEKIKTSDSNTNISPNSGISVDNEKADTNNVISQDGSYCIIALVNEFRYDNKVLNHLELLKISMQYFGLSKVLDLSMKLPQELMTEAIGNNDSELLLAGMMSVDY